MASSVFFNSKGYDAMFGQASRDGRICSAQETFDRVWPKRHKMGITRLANITGLDRLNIPVFIATRPNSRALSISQGKGCTEIHSKVSALMESVEGFHGERISLPLKLGNINDLSKKHNMVDFLKLPLIDGAGFDEYTRTLWIEGYDLLNERSVWVPYELVHEDCRVPNITGEGFFVATSNGLASGNHPVEAINHGICEVVERDAIRLWQLLPDDVRDQTKVDLSTIDDDTSLDLIETFLKSKINVGVWEITSDIGIPAYVCRIISNHELEKYTIRPASGMGCSLDKKNALRRALTEAAQSRLTFISGTRDDLDKRHYKESVTKDVHELWNQSISARSYIDFHKTPSFETNSPYQIYAELINRLKKKGIEEIITFDLSMDELEVPVFKTVIPGLEGPPVHKNLALGRRAMKLINTFI
jgi:ribosomal protein S12 methylthiotransferase accessory factor